MYKIETLKGYNLLKGNFPESGHHHYTIATTNTPVHAHTKEEEEEKEKKKFCWGCVLLYFGSCMRIVRDHSTNTLNNEKKNAPFISHFSC